MRTITITFDPTPGCGWDVQEDGKCCNGLCWGEMLEQVVALTIPKNRVGTGYEMRTPAEWKEREELMAARRPQQAVPPLLLEKPLPV
ncbi:MAG: hypothetical protein WAW73_20155 [Rhodoferax sp.]